MTETQFKIKVIRYLKVALPGAWIFHPADKFQSGIPDLLILFREIFAAIELKVGKNKPSKIQLVQLDRLAKAGAMTRVCWTMDEIKEMVRKIVAKAPRLPEDYGRSIPAKDFIKFNNGAEFRLGGTDKAALKCDTTKFFWAFENQIKEKYND